MTTAHRSSRRGGRRRGRGGRRADATLFSSSTSDAFAVMFVVLFVVLGLTIVERDDSPSSISFTAVSALQTTSRVVLNHSGPTTTTTRTTALNLGPMDDLSEYGKNKQRSELDNLTSKREAIKRARLANIKPNDDEPRLPLTTANGDDDNNDDDISQDELQQLLQRLQKEKKEDPEEDDLFAMPEFKTKRIANNNQQRGLSSGNYGADTTSSNGSSNKNNNVGGPKKTSSNDENDANGNNNATTEDEEEEDNDIFIDWTTDYNDENELHIPNRIGITTRNWGNVKLGYVDGKKKLKKKDRAVGRYNKNDLKVREDEDDEDDEEMMIMMKKRRRGWMMTRIMCNCQCSCFRSSAHTHTHHPSNSFIEFENRVTNFHTNNISFSLSLSKHTYNTSHDVYIMTLF